MNRENLEENILDYITDESKINLQMIDQFLENQNYEDGNNFLFSFIKENFRNSNFNDRNFTAFYYKNVNFVQLFKCISNRFKNKSIYFWKISNITFKYDFLSRSRLHYDEIEEINFSTGVREIKRKNITESPLRKYFIEINFEEPFLKNIISFNCNYDMDVFNGEILSNFDLYTKADRKQMDFIKYFKEQYQDLEELRSIHLEDPDSPSEDLIGTIDDFINQIQSLI